MALSGHMLSFTSTSYSEINFYPATMAGREKASVAVLRGFTEITGSGGAYPEWRGVPGDILPSLPSSEKNGSWHPVIDLPYLNKFINYKRFKRETLATIQQVVQPEDWLLSKRLGCLLPRSRERGFPQIPLVLSWARTSAVHLPPLG